MIYDLEIKKVESFRWVCPLCTAPNYQENNPDYIGSVYCGECNSKIELCLKQGEQES